MNINGDYGHYGYGGGWIPGAGLAYGAAVGITAAAIGSMVYSLPPSCSSFYYTGSPYYNCGGTYYAPQYQGTDVTYIVVENPEGGSSNSTQVQVQGGDSTQVEVQP